MPGFAITDSHVHLYDPTHLRYSWLKRVPKIDRRYDLADFDRCRGEVAVERRSSRVAVMVSDPGPGVPADEEHAYGHTKAEYFASGFEGALILVAAATIAVTAGRRLLDPQPVEAVGIGLAIVTHLNVRRPRFSVVYRFGQGE